MAIFSAASSDSFDWGSCVCGWLGGRVSADSPCDTACGVPLDAGPTCSKTLSVRNQNRRKIEGKTHIVDVLSLGA